ncbi:hypothetical protein NE237_021651 [Protea cynaroides]|uniref:Uncharacterized protein n=1 Tax=Protea cynaroides TaxID=273540 RepID=A0A9Q0K3G8_9MAGN|nr:hypothetical protein NE237_021651 [Protea cynaroides]
MHATTRPPLKTNIKKTHQELHRSTIFTNLHLTDLVRFNQNPSTAAFHHLKAPQNSYFAATLASCGTFDNSWLCDIEVGWWDSSPNRELIHHAIEAFEEHQNNEELSKKNNGRGKKKDRMSCRCVIEKVATDRLEKERVVSEQEAEMPEKVFSILRPLPHSPRPSQILYTYQS